MARQRASAKGMDRFVKVQERTLDLIQDVKRVLHGGAGNHRARDAQ